MARELTQEELDLQKEKGLLYRRLMEESIADMLDAGITKPVVLLSGGIDSCSTLWSLFDVLERRGIKEKPGVITLELPTTEGGKLSADRRRAEALARHYDLPFYATVPPMDPDEVARSTERIMSDYPELEGRRSDIEPLYLMDLMYADAERLGYDGVFSGISDASIHLVNRKFEIAGRSKKLPVQRGNYMRLDALYDDQFLPLNDMALKRGLKFAVPIRMVAYQLPYNGVEWDVVNSPNLKAITRRAYQKEIDETKDTVKFTVLVQPMQTGDSGAREYFDGLLSRSDYAHERVGRAVTSARVWYNWLLNVYRNEGKGIPRREKGADYWEVFLSRVYGRPMDTERDEKGKPFEYQWDPETGKDLNPPKLSAGDLDDLDEDSLFGGISSGPDEELAEGTALDVDGRVIQLNDEGEPDCRTDCWGIPFWEGPVSWHGCARARAGLCGSGTAIATGEEDPTYSYALCERFDVRTEEALEELDLAIKLYSDREDPMAEAYQKWRDRAAGHYEALAEGELERVISALDEHIPTLNGKLKEQYAEWRAALISRRDGEGLDDDA